MGATLENDLKSTHGSYRSQNCWWDHIGWQPCSKSARVTDDVIIFCLFPLLLEKLMSKVPTRWLKFEVRFGRVFGKLASFASHVSTLWAPSPVVLVRGLLVLSVPTGLLPQEKLSVGYQPEQTGLSTMIYRLPNPRVWRVVCSTDDRLDVPTTDVCYPG